MKFARSLAAILLPLVMTLVVALPRALAAATPAPADSQINPSTVGTLGLAWFQDLHTSRGVEAAPLEVDGTLYDIQPWNITTAFDARTGRLLWTYDPKVGADFGRKACCDIVSRGLAVWQGKVVIATLDGRLIALDARDGHELWSVQTFDRTQPYTITGAPRVFDGKVLIGNAGGDFGTRGYISAYDVRDGAMLWRFYTVPGDPAQGFESPALATAAKTWRGEWWRSGGGGNVWDAIAYDPASRLVYFGTANAAPWATKFRGGTQDSLYTASIVAVALDTGRYAWHYQETPGDEWDYDANEPLVLADLKIRGRTRKVLMQAPKNGFFYVLDRLTGKLISAEPYVPVTWASHVDLKTGRPVVNPAVRYGEHPTLVSPGPAGAHSFQAMAYSPQTGLVYFPVTQTFFGYSAASEFTPGHGSGLAFTGYDAERKQLAEYGDAHLQAWLTAWDPVAQKERWRVPYPRNGSGGVLATAGNLVFEGTIGETFAAYRATDGVKVWEMPIQNIAIGAPISYSLDGEQYIAVNAGWGGGTAHLEKLSIQGSGLVRRPDCWCSNWAAPRSFRRKRPRSARPTSRPPPPPIFRPCRKAPTCTPRTAPCAMARKPVAGSRICATCRRRPMRSFTTSFLAVPASRTGWPASPTP